LQFRHICVLTANLQALALSTDTSREQSKAMFWIVIPIAFILFAVLGALLIKFVMHDLSECQYSACCSGGKTDDDDVEAYGSGQQQQPQQQQQQQRNVDNNKQLDENTLNSLIERSNQSKYGVSRSVPEAESFLPTVSEHIRPVYLPTTTTTRHEHSPPPSYKSETSSVQSSTHDVSVQR
jgi:hypothetical protein